MDGSADSAFFSSIREATRFFIVRHGQSEGNARRLFQGRLDMPLDGTGRAQAGSLGLWLAQAGVDTLLSSPLARAAETARIAAAACSLPGICIDPAFTEIDTGVFTGLGFEESRERHPEVFSAFSGQSWEAVPGAEKAEALYERALAAWSVLRGAALESAAEGGGRAIACVSHGGFIQWLVRATFGGRSWMPLVSTANCGVYELLVEPTRAGPAYLQWRLMNFQAPETLSRPAVYAPHSGSV
jgi:broad specificity phosphatase PhoE